MDILVILEDAQGTLHRQSLEAIAAAQSLAGDLGLTTAALALGSPGLVEAASGLELDEVLSGEDPLLTEYTAGAYSAALQQVIEAESPDFVLLGHTYRTRDFIPVVSARLGRPFIADVTAYRLENGAPRFNRPVFNGKLTAEVAPGSQRPYLVSFQSGAFPFDGAAEGSAPTRSVVLELDPARILARPEPPFQEAEGEVDLSAAEVVVTIGRGIGKEENLPLVLELARALGGEVGSSRPVVDAGWLPPGRQIGSSGQTVTPKLYLALGISGAIQHVVGMKGSQHVIAINKDPEAPIFELADYGVVGDILELIPQLTEALSS